MSPLMPEVRDALVSAARERARPRRRVLRRTGALGVAVVLAGGTAVAATTWRPQLGDDDRGHPTVAAQSVPADQVNALGVLRREQTTADRGPRVQATLRLLAPSEDGGVHVDGVRLLAEHDGGALVLVPLERIGRDDPGYPSSIRRDVICALQYSDAGGAGKSCGTTADLRAGDIAGSMSVDRGLIGADDLAETKMRYFQLVPDGVARVEVTLRDGSLHLLDVRNNAIALPLSEIGLVSNIRTRWLDTSGREITKTR